MIQLQASVRTTDDPARRSLDLLTRIEIRANELRAALADGCTATEVDEIGPKPDLLSPRPGRYSRDRPLSRGETATGGGPVRLRRRRNQPEVTGPGYAVAELEQALAPPPDPTAAGFFDLDNTMLQGASVYYLARGLAARKFFTARDLIRFGLRQMRFRILAAEHGGHVSQAREQALAFVAGRPVEEPAHLRGGDLR